MATDRGQGAAAAEWNALSRDEVLRRIEALAADFLECLSDGKLLELEAAYSIAYGIVQSVWLDLVYPLTNSPSLREDKFYEMVPSILITGRGFPDLATRVFVSLLSHALKIPVLGLCDCNPFGLSIMLTYKLGSARMPLESLEYAVDIKWIGVRPSQVATLGLPQSSFKALTQKDIAVANSLLQASFVQANEHYRREVRMWLEDSLPWKIELEALHFLGFTFLTSFLQDCIEGDNFL
ncbi:hypothetical protein PF003_g4306 [Phytophthora fragariae]|nr:hypothetical protein PF003_g4306 [Phytophthora fragariae]